MYRCMALIGFLLNGSLAWGAEPVLSFQRDIQSIFDANCVACHQAGSAQAGLVLEDGVAWSAVVGRTSSEVPFKLVAAGSPETSYLLHKIAGEPDPKGWKGERMPLGGKLDAVSIARIRLWIKQGANNN